MTLLQGDFDYIRDLVFRRTSIVLEPGKEYLAVTRLEPIRRGLGMRSITELVVALRADPKSPLLDQVAEAMTTNETSFFRDTHPYESLRTTVIPDLIERNKGLRTLRIWSAGCATGQEPYSIAMMLREDFPLLLTTWRVQILATDVSALSLRDDAAVLRPPEGQEIVLTCDTIVEGVHFLKDDPAGSIGHKALAVNLSDLAAKGARPYVYLLALALPAKPDPAWLEAFASGLGALQSRVGASLVGGDTTRTPGLLSITITALGLVPHGHAVLRLGAKRGNRLYVTGTIGDAHLGLRLLKDPKLASRWGLTKEDVAFLAGRYLEPKPRTTLALALRNFAAAAIDVSDGLVGDVDKLSSVSHGGAVIEADSVPD